MKDNHEKYPLTRMNRWTAIALVAIFIAGVVFAWWTVKHADRQMREDLLLQARLVERAINSHQIKTLTGTEADLEKPDYLQLKERLAFIRRTNDKCRFLYLMGRKSGGMVFFYVDSEPATSKDCSPAGQLYEEAPKGFRQVFDTGNAVVDGPFSDRWGKWVTALVPVTDPTTGQLIAVLGMDVDARTWKKDVTVHAILPISLMLALMILLVLWLIASRSREKLRESEEKFRVLADSTPTAVLLYQDERLIYTNKAAETISGYSAEELSVIHIGDLLHPDDRALIQERGWRNQQREEVTKRYELKILTKDGVGKWIVFAGTSTIVGNRPAGIISMVDITERKQAEMELLREKLFTEKLLESLPGIFFLYDSTCHLKRWNKSHETATGFGADKLRDWYIPDWHETPEDAAMGMALVKSVLETGVGGAFETTLINKEGRFVPYLISITRLLTPDGPAMMGVGIDITERKQVEKENRNLVERLRRAEKMEALGQLAGGVAHDLNNILGILTGYSELLLLEIPEGCRSRSHVEKILQSTEKGAAIIQDLLTLARRGVTASDVINLNGVVSGFLKTPVFEKIRDFNPHVTFRTECDENLLNIKGSSVHLEKTLMNLVTNAAESISGEGEVTIRTESRYLDKTIEGYDEVREGDYAVLTVSDTGMGIPAENREKIFEPFYTKKTMGRSGTGLGLAIVWGTVKDHNGYIDLQTEVGQGTTFTLYFPVTREEMIVPLQKAPMERYMGNGESVLVVDDVAEQRDVASGLLSRLGYNVHAVSSGEAAVEYLKEHRADILVLDMIMEPGIDGAETYQRVIAINPEQRAILVSGFSQTDRVREAQKLGARTYVKKPYAMETIGVAIRNELDRK